MAFCTGRYYFTQMYASHVFNKVQRSSVSNEFHLKGNFFFVSRDQFWFEFAFSFVLRANLHRVFLQVYNYETSSSSTFPLFFYFKCDPQWCIIHFLSISFLRSLLRRCMFREFRKIKKQSAKPPRMSGNFHWRFLMITTRKAYIASNLIFREL